MIDARTPDTSLPCRVVVKTREGVDSDALRAAVGSAQAAAISAHVERPTVDHGHVSFEDLFERLLRIETPNMAPAEADAIARELSAHPAVEYAHVEHLLVPPPDVALDGTAARLKLDVRQDLALDTPTAAVSTPDFIPMQTYQDDTVGLRVGSAHAAGILGQNVGISDCEFGWNANHEMLAPVQLTREAGQTPAPQVAQAGYDQHGTAFLSIMTGAGVTNGIRGMAPQASYGLFSEFTTEGGSRRVQAILNAVAASHPGDVVVLEMQTAAPSGAGDYVPAEYDESVWDVVKRATDAGVVIVAAGGNGSQDLDSAPYQDYMKRGDSGAIIVGAGSADSNHQRLEFSTFGSRVNVQGFGEHVNAAGYGDLWKPPGTDDPNRYYHRFGGTSSALPCAAFTVGLVQSHAKDVLDRPLTPAEVRTLLVETGTPQAGAATGHIGPLPNVEAALAAVDEMVVPKPPASGKSTPETR